jgi:L-arabinose isomerase
MKIFEKSEVWFITGSQHLYGEETLRQVAGHSREIASFLNDAAEIPANVIFKPVLTDPDSVYNLILDANRTPKCIGLIIWMHTFSPAKMWIAGLKNLQKPFVHLHTQYNRDLPWNAIDMDFMNLNQSAHGDREFGYICTRLRLNRKVVVGHWREERVRQELSVWIRAAAAWQDSRLGRIARFGDNMRAVAVTEGDKVEAQIRFGYAVDGFGIGELVNLVSQVSEKAIDNLLAEYSQRYVVAKEARPGGSQAAALREAARIELGLRCFLEAGNFTGFTTTFEDLHGLKQLPGLAVQRLMADGYGFGAEGDWKTAALVRAMKVMATGLKGGTSFMEDYTYHLAPNDARVLGAHMLEVCESIAAEKPRIEVHPLSIGGKDDPPRLVFNVPAGPALNVSVIDLGERFRMILNEVESVAPEADLPKLPVARVVWIPQPNLQVAAHCWILAGGAHHTAFSPALTAEYLRDFAEMAGVELVEINAATRVAEFKKELRWNEAVY